MIARDTFSAGVQNRFAIDEEPVMVPAMVERDLNEPSAVGLPFHRVGSRIPIVEVAHEMDLGGFRSETNEIGGIARFLAEIMIAR